MQDQSVPSPNNKSRNTINPTMSNDSQKQTVLKPRPHPPVQPHGELESVLEDIWLVTGSMQMQMMPCVKISFSRNMVVIRQQQGELVLVNSVRLDDDGLKSLDELGTVKHIVRLSAFHGSDDPFYKERYPQAKVWAVEKTTYFPGFDLQTNEIYFQPDQYMKATTKLPFDKSSLIVIPSETAPEGILVLERPEGKLFVTGDSLQNWEKADQYFNCLTKILFREYIAPCQVGPGWAKESGVEPEELHKLLEYKFDHVLPTHGRPVMGQAWKKYEPSIMGFKKK